MSYKDKIAPTVKILEDAAKAVPFPPIADCSMPTQKEMDAYHEASSKQMPFYNQAYAVEVMAYMLDDVLPKSFKPLTKEEIKKYWLAKCEKCYWWGSSILLAGGGRDYWGEYDDPKCPICGTDEVIAIDNKKIKFVEVDL